MLKALFANHFELAASPINHLGRATLLLAVFWVDICGDTAHLVCELSHPSLSAPRLGVFHRIGGD